MSKIANYLFEKRNKDAYCTRYVHLFLDMANQFERMIQICLDEEIDGASVGVAQSNKIMLERINTTLARQEIKSGQNRVIVYKLIYREADFCSGEDSLSKLLYKAPEEISIFCDEMSVHSVIVSSDNSFEAFGGKECAIEVKVKVIYGGKGNDIISQYVAFTKVYNEQVRHYGRSREAVTETIRICKDRDVLREFLAGREKEVISIMMALFDNEKIMRTHVENEKKEASKETARKAAEQMLKLGKLSAEEIAGCFIELSVEDIQEIEKGLLQTV